MKDQTLKDIDKAFRALDALDDIRADVEMFKLSFIDNTKVIDAVLEVIDRHISRVNKGESE